MPGPENGPSPEDMGINPEAAVAPDSSADTPETSSPEPAPETPPTVEQVPVPQATENVVTPPPPSKPEKRGIWPFHKKEKQPEQPKEVLTPEQKLTQSVEAARIRRANNLAEVIKNGARNPEELVDTLSTLSFKELKEVEEQIKHGKGIAGRVRALRAGDRDFTINKDGTIAWKALNEAGRKVANTLLNKRTATSAVTLSILGLLSGGIGWAAGGVLLGGVAGRGVAELGESVIGKTRGAREKVLEAERERWEEMQKLILESKQTEDPMKRNNIIRQVTDLMYRQGNNALLQNLSEKEGDLKAREEKFNKIRNRLQTAGELTGAVAGLTSILNGGVEHLDMDLWNKIDGQKIFHGVQQSHQGWNFLYRSGAEAGRAVFAGAHVIAGGSAGAHTLGATTAQVLGWTIGERTAPMLLASMLAWNSERRGDLSNLKTESGKVYESRDDSKQVYYTRSSNGTFTRWENNVIEEKDKDGKIIGKKDDTKQEAVTIDKLPEAVRLQFENTNDDELKRQAKRVKEQIPTTREYLASLADKNGSFIPENPRGYTYDWKTQPKVIDDKEALRSVDRWYLYTYDSTTGQENPFVDPSTGRIVDVSILGVDADHNRIAYAKYEHRPDLGDVSHIPVETQRLDDFLTKYRLHLYSRAGSPFVGAESSNNPKDPSQPFWPDRPKGAAATLEANRPIRMVQGSPGNQNKDQAQFDNKGRQLPPTAATLALPARERIAEVNANPATAGVGPQNPPPSTIGGGREKGPEWQVSQTEEGSNYVADIIDKLQADYDKELETVKQGGKESDIISISSREHLRAKGYALPRYGGKVEARVLVLRAPRDLDREMADDNPEVTYNIYSYKDGKLAAGYYETSGLSAEKVKIVPINDANRWQKQLYGYMSEHHYFNQGEIGTKPEPSTQQEPVTEPFATPESSTASEPESVAPSESAQETPPNANTESVAEPVATPSPVQAPTVEPTAPEVVSKRPPVIGRSKRGNESSGRMMTSIGDLIGQVEGGDTGLPAKKKKKQQN